MFIAVYRWRVKPGYEEQFRAAWVRGTHLIRAKYGSFGSRLHHDKRQGWFVGYAQWPDEATWRKAMDNHMKYDEPETRRKFVEALAKPETGDDLVFGMDVTDDLLELMRAA
jgi:hypothetical protein